MTKNGFRCDCHTAIATNLGSKTRCFERVKSKRSKTRRRWSRRPSIGLLAVLYRSLQGPTSPDEAKTFFREGFPAEKITTYLDRWRDRFWLFDEKYPFSQVPDFVPKNWRAWSALASEHNADNAKVLFDHVDINHGGAITQASAARWILATQTFAVSSGKSELAHTGTSPSAGGVMAIVEGANLRQTLTFNLVFENRQVLDSDKPIWEREQLQSNAMKDGPSRSPFGFADLYTWQGRSIRLRDSGADVEFVGIASASIDPKKRR